MTRKFALVTGASSGIGKELARLLARGGYDLLVVARDEKALEKLKTELHARYGTDVHVLAFDLAHQNSALKVADKAATLPGTVEVLVNNAGFGDYGSFSQSDWNKISKMINLNIYSLTYLTWLLLPHMLKSGKGRVLNVASTAAFFPGPLMSVYYASKAYVRSFSLGLSQELRGSGVTVTTLFPGPTDSSFQKRAKMGQSRLAKNKRLAAAYEVAHYGYEKMMEGKKIAVPGIGNKLSVFAGHLLPDTISARLVYMAQRPRKSAK